MPRTIYIVFGTTGEYSDRSEWPVRAFFDASKAAELEHAADVRAKTIEKDLDGRWYDSRKQLNEHDPEMFMDYTGTSYYTLEVQLEE